MAIIRNTASMMMRGRIGNTSYYTSEGRQLARQAQNNSNYGETATRTAAQQERRTKWSNLVNFYSGNKAWMKKAYEDLKPGVSIFNRFIQLNISAQTISLTKSEAQAKIWVPALYRVSQGSLAPITDGTATTLTFAPETTQTIGAISQALLNDNPSLQVGDAIVCVRFYGTRVAPGSASGVLPATYKYDEFTIDPNSSQSTENLGWTDLVGKFGFAAATSADAYVYIHTRKSGGKLFVSTEDMLYGTGTENAVSAWKAVSQQNAAIKSYGEFTLVPLDPGGSSSQQSGNDTSSGGNSGGGDDDENLGE